MLLALSACVGGGATTPSPSTTGTTPLKPRVSPEVLAPARLEADLGGHARGWKTVLFVPFGTAEDELGAARRGGGSRSGPRAFAIDCGSVPLIWIADDAKHRLVEYAANPDGSLIDGVGIPDRFEVRDLVTTTCGQLYGLLDGRRGVVGAIGARGVTGLLRLSDGRTRLAASRLFASPAISLHALALGAVRTDARGYRGFGTVDPDTGVLTPTAGLPFGTGASVDVSRNAEARFTVTWFDRGEPFATRALTIRPVAADGSTIARGEVDIQLESVSPAGRLAAFVRLRVVGGGRDPTWMLEIPAEPTAGIRLRSLPSGGSDRRFLYGPDAQPYLMITTRAGVRILRR